MFVNYEFVSIDDVSNVVYTDAILFFCSKRSINPFQVDFLAVSNLVSYTIEI